MFPAVMRADRLRVRCGVGPGAGGGVSGSEQPGESEQNGPAGVARLGALAGGRVSRGGCGLVPGLREAGGGLILGPEDTELLEGGPEERIQPDCAREELDGCAAAVCASADEPHEVEARGAPDDLRVHEHSERGSEGSRWPTEELKGMEEQPSVLASVLSPSGQTAASASA